METWQSRLEASSVDTEHKSFVHDVAYDFYGHRMATCSADKEVRVFERRVVDDATATHAAVLSVDDAVGEEEEEPQVEWRLTSAFGSGEHQAPVHRCVVAGCCARPRSWAFAPRRVASSAPHVSRGPARPIRSLRSLSSSPYLAVSRGRTQSLGASLRARRRARCSCGTKRTACGRSPPPPRRALRACLSRSQKTQSWFLPLRARVIRECA